MVTLTLAPAPLTPTTVEVDVSREGGTTDIGLAGELGRRSVVVPLSGSVDIAIPTADNEDLWPSGSLHLVFCYIVEDGTFLTGR